MTQCPAAVSLFKRQKLYRAVLIKNSRQVLRFAVNLSSQYLLGQAVADLFYKIQNARAGLNLAQSTVLQRNLQHCISLLKLKKLRP